MNKTITVLVIVTMLILVAESVMLQLQISALRNLVLIQQGTIHNMVGWATDHNNFHKQQP